MKNNRVVGLPIVIIYSLIITLLGLIGVIIPVVMIGSFIQLIMYLFAKFINYTGGKIDYSEPLVAELGYLKGYLAGIFIPFLLPIYICKKYLETGKLYI